MGIIEKGVNIIVERIKKKSDISNEALEVTRYGIFAIIQITLSIGLVILFGILFNVLLESLIASITIAWLRKSSGGVHASTPEICLIVGTISAVAIGLISKGLSNITYLELLNIIIYMYSYIIVSKKAPVQSENKKINKEKRIRLKKKSKKVVILLIALSMCFVIAGTISNNDYKAYGWSISLAVLWQVYSLTSFGEKSLSKIDFFLNKYLYKRGE